MIGKLGWQWPRVDASSRVLRWSPRVVLASLAFIVAVLAVLLPPQGRRLVRAPAAAAKRVVALSAELRSTSPGSPHFPDEGALAGLASYVRACTAPDDRIMLAWFAPEVFFFAERGFAGGMAVFLGEHWSSDRDQRRTIEQIDSQAVPLVILQAATAEAFRSAFPRVSSYIQSSYAIAGETSFGDPRVARDGYQVLVRRTLSELPLDDEWRLPCPRTRS